MSRAVELHDQLVAEITALCDGELIKARGEGDSHFAVFQKASQAVECAVRLQQRFGSETWPTQEPLTMRIAIHTGEVQHRAGDYYGSAVNRAARLRSIAHGGQVLISLATRELCHSNLEREVGLLDLGEHRLKDLMIPEHVFQIVAPGLKRSFPPLRSLSAANNNLPIQLTSFVGRDEEINAVSEKLEERSLVTLTGPGGCGKTRLALQVAAEISDKFEDGVWIVDLIALQESESIPAATAIVLNIRGEHNVSPTESILQELESKRLLLILDNCEHLGTGPATFVDSLIKRLPGVKILATSRRSLGLSTETAHIVRPLKQPPRNEPLEQLAQYESVRLLMDRASAKAQNFALSEENAGAVAELSEALGGIPLAIELAASKLRLLAPDQILKRLRKSIDLLKATEGDIDERHRTLRATIDWSYRQLGNAQLLLQRLSVFPGGCTIEAAEIVCAGGIIEEEDVLEHIESLIDNSLVQVESGDVPRYRILETIRQYVAEIISPQELKETQARLYYWALDFARTTKPLIRGDRQEFWLASIQAEYDNLRFALEWACAQEGEENLAILLASELDRFWIRRGMIGEGGQWLTKSLACPGSVPPAIRATALRSSGIVAWHSQDLDNAERLLDESLTLCRTLGDKNGIAGSLSNLGLLAVDTRQFEKAEACFLGSLTLYDELGDVQTGASVLHNLGTLAADANDLNLANMYYGQALGRARSFSDKFMVASTLFNMGNVAKRANDLPLALTYFKESLENLVTVKHPMTAAKLLVQMASISYIEEHFEISARLMGCVEQITETTDTVLDKEDAEEASKLIADLREALGPQEVKGAIAQSKQLGFEAIVDYALSGIDLLSATRF